MIHGSPYTEFRTLPRVHTRRLDDVSSQFGSLREAVTHYHSSVLGHGILITELDARVRRIEDHLKLPPSAA